MRFRWRTRREPIAEDLAPLRAELAQAQGRRRLAEAYRDHAEKILERNHFAEAIEVSMRRKYGNA